MFGKQFAQRVKLRRGPAGFADRRIVVVAGDLRGEWREIICARIKSKRGAAVRHVDAEGNVMVEHPIQFRCNVRGAAGVMRLAPTVEPAGIILANHKGTGGANFTKGLKSFLRIAADIDDAEQILTGVVGQFLRTVTGEKRNIETGGF